MTERSASESVRKVVCTVPSRYSTRTESLSDSLKSKRTSTELRSTEAMRSAIVLTSSTKRGACTWTASGVFWSAMAAGADCMPPTEEAWVGASIVGAPDLLGAAEDMGNPRFAVSVPTPARIDFNDLSSTFNIFFSANCFEVFTPEAISAGLWMAGAAIFTDRAFSVFADGDSGIVNPLVAATAASPSLLAVAVWSAFCKDALAGSRRTSVFEEAVVKAGVAVATTGRCS